MRNRDYLITGLLLGLIGGIVFILVVMSITGGFAC